MDKSPKPFRIILIAVFVVLLLFGFLGFSGKLDGLLPGDPKDINYGEVVLWGSIPTTIMQPLIANGLRDERAVSIKYVEHRPEDFTQDFIEALAIGKGPDLVLLPQDELVKNFNKLALIPYSTILERDFKNIFIEEGEMFLRPDGIVALPFMVDPLVMYWNRDIFTNALLASPPKYWSEFYDLVPKITVREQSGSISKSLVSFGEYRNVTNAKEVLSMLLMQAGSPIVSNKNGSLAGALLVSAPSDIENPVVTAMRFYTEFSKPNKDSYSWNRSLPSSHAMFEAGDLAVYFGYASEYRDIAQKNPHLNFDVAMVPQVGKTSSKLTFGRIYGVSTVASSKNSAGALYASMLLSNANTISGVSSIKGLPPVRRDLIAVPPADAILSVFYDSALISRAWYDPSPVETNSIFMNMIESVNSGRSSMNQALSVAQGNFDRLFQEYRQE